MEKLQTLNHDEMASLNGGWKTPLGIGGIFMIFDAITAFYQGIEDAYNEINNK